MLNGLTISEVNFKDINLDNRVDAEYFDPSYLSIEKTLINLNSQPLSAYCSITGSAFYPAATHLYEIGEVPFIRCVDCINYPIITTHQNDSFEKIPQYFADEHKNIKILKNNDIVITKVGTPCFASIIDGFEQVALSRTVLGLYNIKSINPFFLTVFLRSKYGFQQLFRERELTIQYQLTLERVGKILVYRPENHEFEKLIADIFKQYHTSIDKATRLYQQAEHLLLSELGLAGWQPTHQPTFVRNFSEFLQADRLDAEYFQPKYYDILKSIHQNIYEYRPLSTLIESIKNGFDYRDFCEQGTPYIRVADVKNGRINVEHAAKVAITHNEIKKDVQLKTGDVLFTRKGSFGNAAVVRRGQEEAIISSEIMLLRIREEFKTTILPDYLTLYLNSDLGYQQVEQKVHGVGYYSISQPDLGQVAILLPPLSFQQELVRHISESLTCEDQSKVLLNIAKHGVELAIEQDEQSAEIWIRGQVQALGIEHERN